MHCLDLAALDTLQHSLAGDSEHAHCFPHWQEVVTRFALKPSDERIGQADTPRRARRQLLSSDDPVVKQTVDGRRGDAKRDSSLPDGQQFAVELLASGLEAWDIPMAA
jgi:hypothetical protein